MIDGSGCRASRAESKLICKKRIDFGIIEGLVQVIVHQLPFYKSRENRYNRDRSEVGWCRRLVNFGDRVDNCGFPLTRLTKVNPICMSFVALSLLVQAAVHCNPYFTEFWLAHSPAMQQCRLAEPFLFCGWSNNLERATLRSEAPPKWFSVSPAF